MSELLRKRGFAVESYKVKFMLNKLAQNLESKGDERKADTADIIKRMLANLTYHVPLSKDIMRLTEDASDLYPQEGIYRKEMILSMLPKLVDSLVNSIFYTTTYELNNINLDEQSLKHSLDLTDPGLKSELIGGVLGFDESSIHEYCQRIAYSASERAIKEARNQLRNNDDYPKAFRRNYFRFYITDVVNMIGGEILKGMSEPE